MNPTSEIANLEERIAKLEKATDKITSLEERIAKLENPEEKNPELNPIKVDPIKVEPIQLSEFEECKELLMSDAWPAAIDPALICNITSDQDKEDRAEGILDLIIDMHLENLKFLDFGCGEGHVINKSIRQNPKLSVGYDITESPRWNQWDKNNSLYTTDWQEVVKNGPYNAILLYDVLDHIQGEPDAAVEELKKIRAVTAPNAKIFVRCHPWCSRHGTHLYHYLNKAYVHIVFSDEELQSMGYKQIYTKPIIHPVNTYHDWFRIAKLKMLKKEHPTRETIEKFFSTNPIIAKRIKSHWKDSPEKELREGTKFPFIQLELQFLDYTLS